MIKFIVAQLSKNKMDILLEFGIRTRMDITRLWKPEV